MASLLKSQEFAYHLCGAKTAPDVWY